jgi:hypothetical protein
LSRIALKSIEDKFHLLVAGHEFRGQMEGDKQSIAETMLNIVMQLRCKLSRIPELILVTSDARGVRVCSSTLFRIGNIFSIVNQKSSGKIRSKDRKRSGCSKYEV